MHFVNGQDMIIKLMQNKKYNLIHVYTAVCT